MLKKLLKVKLRNALYKLGLFGSIHHFRNRRTLTTFMFHRVLPASSWAYELSDKEFTFTVEGFGHCLDFIQRHYNPVSSRDIAEAICGHGTLPDRAALISFDDGWADTINYAVPELKCRGLSGVIFIASSVLESQTDQWWQDTLVGVQTSDIQARDLALALGVQPEIAVCPGQVRDHVMACALAVLDESSRTAILGKFAKDVETGRQMVRHDDLETVDRSVLSLGAHGHTHAPLCNVQNSIAELQTSFDEIKGIGGEPCMSYPHGSYNARLTEEAKQVGFVSIFTSDPLLTDTKNTLLGAGALGRIHVPENQWTCQHGKISFPMLATFLFFRSIAAPD